jgi:hypothetical protein
MQCKKRHSIQQYKKARFRISESLPLLYSIGAPGAPIRSGLKQISISYFSILKKEAIID